MPNKYFSIDGVATYVHHTGPTTLPERPPDLSRGEVLLCLHGAGGNGNTFRALLTRLSLRHSPLAFDQPGHGRSGGLDSLGAIEAMADFSAGFMAKLGLPASVLIGHSMGGAVAIELALTRPECVRALVLCGAAARFEVPDEHVERLRLVTEGKARREFSRDAYSPATPQEIVGRGMMEDARTDPRVGYGDLIACRDWEARDRLGAVGVRTLVVVGADEQALLAEQAERLASEIPGARKIVIPKAGHLAHFEQPDAVADAVEAFLAELPR